MALGYDVAELLAEIKARDAQIALLLPNNFTEAEAKLVISTIRAVHTPDRIRPMDPEAVSVLRKLQTVLDRFETERQGRADFAASLTAEERRFILELRAQRGGG